MSSAAHDCPRCGATMSPARTNGLFALIPRRKSTLEGLFGAVRPTPHVCPDCGHVELRVENPTRFT